ncbi:DUF4159 domain-containing protein [Leptolyngbya sp. FACHB-36]|uniref:DUF4159 domain-containing protein n=1 Tax=Leptolyngbya sp. FACHB-36 TaxID=2692808 RepID=UPI001680354D|nr:DUF4159 domain-containing protein [Leptolyngbya sp. FACHB-36]MBD2021003.1 DUF4159 domain-containing protein [Leptolyngbya sp. FACHB-36]
MIEPPSPEIKPFQRLQVTDGLLMTAERWQRAHEYHRQRQNFHYQALNQPGIVSGLGVHLIAAPADVPKKYQDGRWVQIQPGLAIDCFGNPIVVAQPVNVRITSKPLSSPLTVYLVLRYVDSDTLNYPDLRDFVEEIFRIDEKNSPPNDSEVEVCRLRLQPDAVQLEYAQDGFAPDLNQLDFRYRMPVQARLHAIVRLAQVTHADPISKQRFEQLESLMSAIAPLYPSFRGSPVAQIPFPTSPTIPYDLLYLTGTQSLTLQKPERTALQSYLEAGGVLLVDVPPGGAALAKSVMSLAQQMGTPLEYLNRLSPHHPLRTQPFLFAALPRISDQPIQVLTAGGIVLTIGDLAAAWGLDDALSLPRETLRAAHEFGINLLHFAWKRRSWAQLRGPALPARSLPTPAAAPPKPPSRGKTILDQLLDS